MRTIRILTILLILVPLVCYSKIVCSNETAGFYCEGYSCSDHFECYYNHCAQNGVCNRSEEKRNQSAQESKVQANSKNLLTEGSQKPKTAPDGSKCNHSSDCDSNTCYQSVCISAPFPDGCPCKNSSDCSSNFCFRTCLTPPQSHSDTNMNKKRPQKDSSKDSSETTQEHRQRSDDKPKSNNGPIDSQVSKPVSKSNTDTVSQPVSTSISTPTAVPIKTSISAPSSAPNSMADYTPTSAPLPDSKSTPISSPMPVPNQVPTSTPVSTPDSIPTPTPMPIPTPFPTQNPTPPNQPKKNFQDLTYLFIFGICFMLFVSALFACYCIYQKRKRAREQQRQDLLLEAYRRQQEEEMLYRHEQQQQQHYQAPFVYQHFPRLSGYYAYPQVDNQVVHGQPQNQRVPQRQSSFQEKLQ